MDRRGFLKLSSLFLTVAIIGPEIQSAITIVSNFLNPVYVYKVRSRIGFWVVFKSDTQDLKNRVDTIDKLNDFLCYANSLELVKVIEECDYLKFSEELREKLNSDPSVIRQVEENIKFKYNNKKSSDLQKKILSIGLFDWWEDTFTSEEKEIIIQRQNDWGFLESSGKSYSLSVTADLDNGSKINALSKLSSNSRPTNREFYNNHSLVYKTSEINQFLCKFASAFNTLKDSKIQEKVLNKWEGVYLDLPESFKDEDQWVLYDLCIEHYYKRRTEGNEFYEKSKYYCKKQILLCDIIISSLIAEKNSRIEEDLKFIEDQKMGVYGNYRLTDDEISKLIYETPSIGTCRGITQLSIIYEREGEYNKSLELCKLAKSQMWYGDWDSKISRIDKKIKSKNLII